MNKPGGTLRQQNLFFEEPTILPSDAPLALPEESTALPGMHNGEQPPSALAQSPHLLIRASAGTGKTFRLSNRYIELLRQCPSERILAVTFTRKAASEILDRVLSRLATAALDPAELARLSAFVGPPRLSRDECLHLLSTLTRDLHRVRIGTLDGFFSRLGTSFALDIGLPPHWTIADIRADEITKLRAVDAVLREGDAGDVRRLVHMLAKGDFPRSVTWLVKAAVNQYHDLSRLTQQVAWNRITPELPLPGEELLALQVALSEFKLSGKRLVAARDADVRNIVSNDWEGLISTGPARNISDGQNTYYRSPIPEDLVTIYERLVHHAKAVLLRIWADQNSATFEILAKFRAARQRILSETRGIRFDDVTAALGEHLTSLNGASLAHRLDSDLDHLLLDEFQDTSLSQWRVLEPFVESVGNGRESSFFCVGDSKQAIYGWRGGVSALFDKAAGQFPEARIEELNQSYRSSPVIMQTVNQVFQNLGKHTNLSSVQESVHEWGLKFPVHDTALKALPGHVTLSTTDRIEGDADDHWLSCSARAADLAAEIVQKTKDVSIGILARKNPSVARLMYDLGARGVLASEEGGVPLVNSAAVRVIQSALRFADSPGHSIARFHVAHSLLGEHYRIMPRMEQPAAQAAALRIRDDLLRNGYERCIGDWAEILKPDCNQREWSRLRRLMDVAARYAKDATLRPGDFADLINQEKVEEPSSSRVRVMTIHKSKGLEFDIVILPELDTSLHEPPAYNACGPGSADMPDTLLTHRNEALASLLPPELRRAFDHQRRVQVHESMCCLYVAMTRARHALHMIIRPQLSQNGSPTQPQATASGILRATLVDPPHALPSKTLFEIGDPEWYRTLPQEPHEESATPLTAPTPQRIELAPMPEGRIRGRERLSPSKAKKRAVEGTFLLSTQTTRSAQRGTLWHVWWQAIGWLDDGLPDEDLLKKAMRRADVEESVAATEIPRFLSKIQQPEVTALLSRKYYARNDDVRSPLSLECFSERPFTLIDHGQHLSGSIDRLVLTLADGVPIAADIIDFKTDFDGEESAARPSYIDQLRLYTRAVSIAHSLDPSAITARLVWLNTGVVETIAPM